jgi:hypothetical protein
MKKLIIVSFLVLLFGIACVTEPVSTPAPIDQEYWVNMHYWWDLDFDKKQIDLVCQLGAKGIRLGWSWPLFEPRQGEWDEDCFYFPDRLVEYANLKGLKVLFTLVETPCWASSDPNKDCGGNESYNKYYPPYDPQLYANALGFMVKRYGDRVYAWEVWNEPNFPRFWGGPPDARDYTAMLQASYTLVKAINPGVIVLGGSLAGADVGYLKAMYAADAYGYFDALALHPYSGGQPPDGCSDPRWSYQCGVEAIRKVMLKNGDDRPVWFTEIGWSSFEGHLGFGEKKQAEYLTQAFEIARSWDYVSVIIWYDLVDDSETLPDDREGYFGLFDTNLNWKPSAEAFLKASDLTN